MNRWEYVLTRDKEVDLENVEDARAWMNRESLTRRPEELSLPMMACVLNKPTKEDVEEWSLAVKTLRSFASRTAGWRRVANRPPHEDPVAADRVVQKYLAVMIPHLQLGPKPLRSTGRLRLIPDETAQSGFFAASAAVFWQVVFASFYFSDQVCGDCQKPLPPTPQGKESKAKLCKACTKKRSWNRKPLEERRRIEAEKKRRQRNGGAA